MEPQFEEFLSQPSPGFWCVAAGDSSKPSILAKVTHEINPPPSLDELAILAGLPKQVSEQFEDFYREKNGFTLYQDTLSEAAGVRVFRISEWAEKATEMREWYEDLFQEEDPDSIIVGLVIGEVPQSGNYFVMSLCEPRIGKVFYVVHDDWYEKPFANNFAEFLIRIIEEPAQLLSEELGCYTRYSDGKTDTQWIPERYVPDTSTATREADLP